MIERMFALTIVHHPARALFEPPPRQSYYFHLASPTLKVVEDDTGDSREERTFRLWVNSLNLDGVEGAPLFVTDLYHDLSNGLNILKVHSTAVITIFNLWLTALHLALWWF